MKFDDIDVNVVQVSAKSRELNVKWTLEPTNHDIKCARCETEVNVPLKVFYVICEKCTRAADQESKR